jgi:hypothetical protein
MKALLVGAHFRPPAKLILAALPAGTPLVLEPEPENPYDPQALKVCIRTENILLDRLADSDLEGYGWSRARLAELEEPLHLGYCAREGNKDLSKLQYLGLSSAAELLAANDNLQSWGAVLAWGPNGEPLVVCVRGPEV